MVLHSKSAVQRMRILVISSDENRRAAIVQSLTDCHYQCLEEAADETAVQELLSQIGRHGGTVDLALIDNAHVHNAAHIQQDLITAGCEISLLDADRETDLPTADTLRLLTAHVDHLLILRHYAQQLAHTGHRSQHLFVRMLEVIVKAISARDARTRNHSFNVLSCAMAIAREMKLSVQELETVRISALLHDLGSIGVREAIFQKPGGLTDEEQKEIRKHPLIASTILEPLEDLNDVIRAIRHQREHWDGSGYPDGLKGENIPLVARIVAPAEAFHAMITDRPHAPARTTADALDEIEETAGSQFDPIVVAALKACNYGRHVVMRE